MTIAQTLRAAEDAAFEVYRQAQTEERTAGQRWTQLREWAAQAEAEEREHNQPTPDTDLE